MHHDTSGIQQQGRSVEIEGQETSRAIQPCEGKKKVSTKKKINEGEVFGRLTAIRPMGTASRWKPLWEFKCSCGNIKTLNIYCVLSGAVRSCKCLHLDMVIKHGHARGCKKASPTYSSWVACIERCRNPNVRCYSRYGGRGIKVCDRWTNSFENFLEDMGHRPFGHTLDRINNDGPYCKENCKWSTPKEQGNNRENSPIITWGDVTLNLMQWSEKTGLSKSLIYARFFRQNWSAEKALTTPKMEIYAHPKRPRISSF